LASADLAGHLVQQLGLLVRADLAPAFEGHVGGGDRRARILLVAHGGLVEHFLGRGILHIKIFAGDAWDALAVDQHELGHKAPPLYFCAYGVAIRLLASV
jgi:hypothetical protein